MTALSDALETRRELAQKIALTHEAQAMVDPDDPTSTPMTGWDAAQDLADVLISEGWVLGRPGSIPESVALEVGPTEHVWGPLTPPEANAILATVAARTPGGTFPQPKGGRDHPWDAAPDVFDEMRQEQEQHARPKYPLEHDVVHGIQHVIGQAYDRLGRVTSEATPENRARLVVVGGLVGAALRTIDANERTALDAQRGALS